MRTLVLNAGYEPMQLISWQRAMCLVLSAKAEVVAEYGRKVHTVSECFPLPSVVRLKGYVRFVKRFGIVKCTRRNLFLRDKYQCQYCGVRCSIQNATLDHIVPSSKGGKTTWDNVVTCCSSCNRRKGDKMMDIAGMSLLRRPRRPVWRDLVGQADHGVDTAWLPFLDAG